MPVLDDFPVQTFQENLLYWFERNMRDLPWRQDKDPYKIWVSEIMLQQTRVDTVIPYFNRFINKFPTLEALADAPEDDVLKLWEGLGYYSRARNLQSAVKEVKESYGGKVPDETEQVLRLKGVGSYTAGAILSIAYGKREPAVDGNVMRVFSRIFVIEEDIQKQKTKQLFENLVRKLIPAGAASYFNQGIMELGALLCTPKNPQCTLCPVREQCKGKELGIEHRFPIKTKKKKPRSQKMVVGVLHHQGKVLIRQRAGAGLLAKLYEFPNVEWNSEEAEEAISKHLYNYYQLQTITAAVYENVKHTFTHLTWDISIFEMNIIDQHIGDIHAISLPADSMWIEEKELDQYAFPVSHQKIKKQYNNRIRI